MKKQIVDIILETTEILDMTQEELVAYEKYKAKADAEVALVMAEQEAKETAKAALLAKLGITAEEAKLLIGGN